MSAPPSSSEAAEQIRGTFLGLLGIAVASAVLVFFSYSWINAQQASTITFNTTPTSHIAIDVRGAVSTPGVVYLQPGSRMIDVVAASGGMSSDADQSLVNLSSRVSDGQMIVIPTQAPDGNGLDVKIRININSASVDELKQLPGIGDVFAQRIVAFREFNGPFQRIDELGDVEGISPSLVESLQPYITVTGND